MFHVVEDQYFVRVEKGDALLFKYPYPPGPIQYDIL